MQMNDSQRIPAPKEKVWAALNDPAIRARLSGDGVELVGGTPEAADAFIRAEMARWPKIIKAGS